MTATQTPSWVCVTEEAGFCPRDTAEPVVFQDMMWLSNGYCHGGELVRDLWRSPDGRRWTRVSKSTPYDGYSEMVAFGDGIWAVKDSVWRSADGLTWIQICAHTPFGARGYGELVVFRDRMWQLGSGPDVWHSEDGVHWERAIAEAPFGPRFGSAVAVYDDRLWLLGGATAQPGDPPEKHYPQYTTHNDVWTSLDGITWTRVLEHAPWEARMWFVAEVYAGRLWAFGGFSNRRSVNFAETWHTFNGVDWERCVSDPMFSARHEVTPYVFEDSLWVVGGNSWPLTNDVWKLTWPQARGDATRQNDLG